MSSYFQYFHITKFFGFLLDSYLILIISIIICFICIKFDFIIPTRIQLFIEKIINYLSKIIKENLGNNSDIYLIFLSSIFFYILIINILNNFVITSSPTAQISITLSLSCLIWISTILFGFFNFKSFYLSLFVPTGIPISLSPLLVFLELISHLCRPISLGVRLSANLTAGPILVGVISDFSFKMLCFSFSFFNLFPLIILALVSILEICVLIIQAYVFTLLSLIYLKDSLILH